MRRYHRVGVVAAAPAGRSVAGSVTVRRRLLGGAWATDVADMEAAIGRFHKDRSLTNECDVALFELASDTHLHVNVTHKYLTKPVPGWAGPGRVPEGFVHNRRFVDTPSAEMIRRVRDMVFAPRA